MSRSSFGDVAGGELSVFCVSNISKHVNTFIELYYYYVFSYLSFRRYQSLYFYILLICT